MNAPINCPVCAASIEQVSPISRSLVCEHCSNLLRFDNSSWTTRGQFPATLDAPPLLRIGRSGHLNKRHFIVEGRIRLQGDSGYWDEWWLVFDNGEGQWVEEDDGSYLLHKAIKFSGSVDKARTLSPGQIIENDSQHWFITEKGQAEVIGAEGQLPVTLSPGFSMSYLDAVADGKELSIEIWQQEISASISQPLDPDTLQWQTI